MKIYLSILAALVFAGPINAGTLVLKITGKEPRNCGPITQVKNANSDTVMIMSQTCTCSLKRSISITDSMELVRSNDRLNFICETGPQDLGDDFVYEYGSTASLTASHYSVEVVKQ